MDLGFGTCKPARGATALFDWEAMLVILTPVVPSLQALAEEALLCAPGAEDALRSERAALAFMSAT